MTFSLIGRSKDGKQLGVAVASKFLAVGAYVPAASAAAGAVATQAYGNLAFKTTGLKLLKQGASPQALLDTFLRDDPQKAERQLGVVDKNGDALTFTGDRCLPWAGGQAENHAEGSYAAQGNMLAGPHVVAAMVTAWLELADEPLLATRLVKALDAGQEAGGDPRGKQAAAILVVEKNAGYGGAGDVAIDLRSDDSPNPIQELLRMIAIHQLYFGKTPEAELLELNDALRSELKILLAKVKHDSGDVSRDLYDWMGRENFEERWHEGKVDPVVLDQLRIFTRANTI